MSAPTPEDVRTARQLMPMTIREHAAVMGGVIAFWREIISNMHKEVQTQEDEINGGIVEGWTEKLDLLFKVTSEAHDELVKEMRTAGYSRQLASGGANLGQWQEPPTAPGAGT